MDNACGHMKQIQHSTAPQRAGSIFRQTCEMGSTPPHAQDDAFIACATAACPGEVAACQADAP